MTPVRRAVESTTTLVVSRLMMIASPFVATALVWFGQQYLEQRFAFAASTASVIADKVSARVDVIDSKIAASAVDRTDFQNRLTGQVDKLTDVAVGTSVEVSAIKASLEALQREKSLAGR